MCLLKKAWKEVRQVEELCIRQGKTDGHTRGTLGIGGHKKESGKGRTMGGADGCKKRVKERKGNLGRVSMSTGRGRGRLWD